MTEIKAGDKVRVVETDPTGDSWPTEECEGAEGIVQRITESIFTTAKGYYNVYLNCTKASKTGKWPQIFNAVKLEKI